MAKYYNVREGKILSINGKYRSQSEIVEPDRLEENIDCRTESVRFLRFTHMHCLQCS